MWTCGIDEAGRGALAGPVSAAAVILGPRFSTYTEVVLSDSKKINASQRTHSAQEIKKHALVWAVAFASWAEIDSINILRATLLAMQRAFLYMGDPLLRGPWYIQRGGTETIPYNRITTIVDGNQTPAIPSPCQAIVKADSYVPEVQAASILAKTTRDNWMCTYAAQDPRYAFDAHKGYPTRKHRDLIARHGASPIHRTSFRW